MPAESIVPTLQVNQVPNVSRVEIGDEPVTIGRSSACTVVLRSSSVSRQHCIIERDGTSIRIRDLGSRFGTRVNGDPVEDAALASGDLIGVGRFEIVFLEGDEAANDAALQNGLAASSLEAPATAEAAVTAAVEDPVPPAAAVLPDPRIAEETAELESLRRRIDADREALAERAARLERREAEHETDRETLAREREADAAALREREEQMQAARRAGEERIEAEHREKTAAIEAEHRENTAAIEAEHRENTAAIEAEHRENTAAIKAERRAQQETIETERRTQEETIAKLQEAQRTEREALEAEHRAQKEALDAERQAREESLEAERRAQDEAIEKAREAQDTERGAIEAERQAIEQQRSMVNEGMLALERERGAFERDRQALDHDRTELVRSRNALAKRNADREQHLRIGIQAFRRVADRLADMQRKVTTFEQQFLEADAACDDVDPDDRRAVARAADARDAIARKLEASHEMREEILEEIYGVASQLEHDPTLEEAATERVAQLVPAVAPPPRGSLGGLATLITVLVFVVAGGAMFVWWLVQVLQDPPAVP